MSNLRINLFFILVLLWNITTAQIEVEPANNGFITGENLVKDLFAQQGIQILNVQYQGMPTALGYFSQGNNEIGLGEGLILSTGQAHTINQANTTILSDPNNSLINNPLLNDLADGATQDVAVLTIEFIPLGDTISFDYVFASEEYPEFGCDCNTDVFGFFLNGPGITGNTPSGAQNLAIIPGSTNIPVSVQTIHPIDPDGRNPTCPNDPTIECQASFSHLYKDNANSSTLAFDGYTNVLNAKAGVIPCETYTLQIAIGDVGDDLFDSAIFLKGRSFNSSIPNIYVTTFSGSPVAVEGGAVATLNFVLDELQSTAQNLTLELLGNAIKDTDYEISAETVTIPAGANIASINLLALEDNITESLDSVGIRIQNANCNMPTTWIYLKDKPNIELDLGLDQTICVGESLQLDGSIMTGLPEVETFDNQTITQIGLIRENEREVRPSTVVEVEVSGMDAPVLTQELLDQICVNIIHSRVADLDLYLELPNGFIFPLSTDNGGNGSNYEMTCFAVDATRSIQSITEIEAPFTGRFTPEGNWLNLWNAESPVNGTWRLHIKDDLSNIDGVLTNFSIHFQSSTQIFYHWVDDPALSCTDCPTPIVSPTETTDFILQALTSNDAILQDTIQVVVENPLPSTTITCSNITNNSILFLWDSIPGAASYEVNINGQGWEMPNAGNFNHNLRRIAFDTEVTIEVRGLGRCNSEIATETCRTTNCLPPIFERLIIDAVSCPGQKDGAIRMDASEPGTIFVIDSDTTTTGVFDSLAGGIYEVELLSADLSCRSSVELTVEEKDSIDLFIPVMNNITCPSGNDGLIVILVNGGGTGPYSFDWNNGLSNAEVLNNVSAGDYEVVVTDIEGCTESMNFTLTEPPLIQLDSFVAAENCQQQDGIAAIVHESGNFSYLWNTGQTTDTIQQLIAGLYSLTLTDENGCQDSLKLTVPARDSIEFTITTTPNFCPDDQSGTATALTVTDTSNFSIAWNDPLAQTNFTAYNLATGNYTATLRDAFGCEGQQEVEIIEDLRPINLSIDTTAINCTDEFSGALRVQASGGYPNYEYSWSTGSTESTINNLNAGLYHLTINDAKGCQKIDSIELEMPNTVSGTIQANDVSCMSNQDGSIQVTAIGGTAPYLLSINERLSDLGAGVFNNLRPDIYDVYLQDANKCEFYFEPVEIKMPTPIQINIEDQILKVGQTLADLDYEILNTTGNINYQWTGDSLSCTNCDTPEFSPTSSSTYQLMVQDANNCTAEANFKIIIDKTRALFVPNAFSPNEDGRNDLLQVFGQPGSKVLTFQVFNRWGAKLFEHNDFNVNDTSIGWDGSYNGQKLNNGVYIWLAEIRYADGEIELWKGETTLLR